MAQQASFLPQSDDFEKFWEVWPRHEAKIAARRAWNKLRMEDRRMAFGGIWKFCGREREFIPHPATYLNGHRWNDEVAPPQPTREQVAAQAGKGPDGGGAINVGECSVCHQRFSAGHLAKNGGKCGSKKCGGAKGG